MSEGKYRCAECGGTDVQMSFPVWMDANDLDDRSRWEPDWEAQPERVPAKCWCRSCERSVALERGD